MKLRTRLLILFFCFLANTLLAQHLKKDGTPDMRYKENKINNSLSTYSYTQSTPSVSPSSNTNLKKDGTPDKRYKENKTATSTYPGLTTTSTSPPKYHATAYSYTVKRDANGKIAKSSTARYQFMKKSGYPGGRPGFVVDHIIPLKKGGCDCPTNMQWQTIAEAKAKDKVE